MSNHKHIICGIVSILPLLFFFSSCFTYNQNGYPKKVHFSSTGGSEIISGNYDATLVINGDNISGKTLTYDMDTIVCTWLKVIRIRGERPSFELIAAPNDNPKKRKLWINLGFGPEYGEITVTQKGR